MWSTERRSLEATAPESTGSRLVEMGTTKEPGRSKNFLAWPSTPFMASEASRVKPGGVLQAVHEDGGVHEVQEA